MSGLDADVLARHAAGQRWYGAADRTAVAAAVVDVEELPGGVAWALLEVRFDDGGTVTYQLVVDPDTHTDVAERPEVVRWMFPGLPVGEVRAVSGEQSNTSLVIDGSAIVKLFRRLGPPGQGNPDVETVRALWEAGYRSVPEPIGEFRRSGHDLAVARRFLAGAASGWQMALDDPHFLTEAADLGAVTARLHLALADAFGVADGDAEGWAASMGDNLDRGGLPAGLDARARFAGLAARTDVGKAVRIHGDYHLGQVLHWRGDWYVLDFEGEPARPPAERTAPSSPLRDVAGMLRSFSYAVAVGGLPADWEREARRLFLAGYTDVEGIAALLPDDIGPVLDAFELDKAVYEVGYERASRPDWEAIPLAAVRRLLA